MKVRRDILSRVAREQVLDLFLCERFRKPSRVPGHAERVWVTDPVDEQVRLRTPILGLPDGDQPAHYEPPSRGKSFARSIR